MMISPCHGGDADGLYVGQDDLSIQAVRAQWNQPSKLIDPRRTIYNKP